jgi:hypothetical protein
MTMHRVVIVGQASIGEVLGWQRVVLMWKSRLRSELSVRRWWFEDTSAVVADIPPDIVHTINRWERWAMFFLG